MTNILKRKAKGLMSEVCTASVAAAIAVSAQSAHAARKSAPPLVGFKTVSVTSSLDGKAQPCRFYAPKKPAGKVPLLVALHTWSYGWKADDPARWALGECKRRGWALIYPDFRGPNWTPAACGSDLAVRDIVDAVAYAKAHAPVDEKRVYLIGASGGGMMALLMAARAPELWAGVYAGCPISDLARWHGDSRRLRTAYWKHLEKACGGAPDVRRDEYARRSPLTYITAAKKVPLQIATGIHDGHTGSVPIGHAIRAFNALAEKEAVVSEADIAFMERQEKVPDALRFTGRDPFFSEKMRIHLRRTSGSVRLTVFEGGHAGNFAAGIDWLARQRLGSPVDWTLPATGRGVESRATR